MLTAGCPAHLQAKKTLQPKLILHLEGCMRTQYTMLCLFSWASEVVPYAVAVDLMHGAVQLQLGLKCADVDHLAACRLNWICS